MLFNAPFSPVGDSHFNENRMDFTAIGDAINTAVRLEANAKRGQVLISDVVFERVKDRIEVEEVGEIPLKGKSEYLYTPLQRFIDNCEWR